MRSISVFFPWMIVPLLAFACDARSPEEGSTASLTPLATTLAASSFRNPLNPRLARAIQPNIQTTRT